MNKKIILINLFIFVLVCILVELFSYCAYFYKYREAIEIQWQNGNKVILSYWIPDLYNPNTSPYNYHIIQAQPDNSIVHKIFEDTEPIRTFRQNSTKKPICFVGCSYTKGSCLTDEETFAYQIAKKTQRTAYLRGVDATGLTQVYYQVKNKLIPQDSEYIVYTFIYDHLNRLFHYQLGFWSTEINLRYELKDGKLQEAKIKFPILYSLYSTKLIQEMLSNINSQKEQQDYILFKAIMADMMQEFKKNYPNSKFVFLLYEQDDLYVTNLPIDIQNYIKSLGYIYLDANELSGEQLGNIKWKIKGEGIHPNAEAWKKVTPNFIKVLNL